MMYGSVKTQRKTTVGWGESGEGKKGHGRNDIQLALEEEEEEEEGWRVWVDK